MPSRRFRSSLLAFALAAFAFACTAAVPSTTRAWVAPSAPLALESAAEAIEYPKPRPKKPARKRRPPRPTLGQRAARIALQAVGVPYRWGGSSPASGFDCSGLVYWAYGRLGVEVPHSSYALYDLGRTVAPSRMRAGDLLFFTGLGHVGLYLGGGKMVHAPQSGRLVEVVTLRRSNYGARIVGARRIVPA